MLPVQECSAEDTKLAVLTVEGIAGGLATQRLAVLCFLPERSLLNVPSTSPALGCGVPRLHGYETA